MDVCRIERLRRPLAGNSGSALVSVSTFQIAIGGLGARSRLCRSSETKLRLRSSHISINHPEFNWREEAARYMRITYHNQLFSV